MAKVNLDCHDLMSLLSSEGRDFLIRGNGDQVKIKDLCGKNVGIYFSASWCAPCRRFTPTLVEVYNKLSSKGDVEIVFISSDKDDESFSSYFSKMPWLAIPFSDSTSIKSMKANFSLKGIPHLVFLDGDGKVSTTEGVKIVREHQVEAYPFSSERITELKEAEEENRRNQSLKSLLVSSSRDYVISRDGKKVPIAQLVGKHILIYFSAHWCPPCRGFTPKLIEAYHEIKAKENNFEVIFISRDRDQSSFDGYYSSMPWLALPFGDERKAPLSRRFKVSGIPFLVSIGPDGKTVTTEARHLIAVYGADAFPFTKDHTDVLKEQLVEMAKGWPETLKHELHEHELVKLCRTNYVCDGCSKTGYNWSFICKECDFDLHPKCALKNYEQTKYIDG